VGAEDQSIVKSEPAPTGSRARRNATNLAHTAESVARGLAAVLLACVPVRHWERMPGFPVHAAAVPSGIATTAAGLYLGARGFLAYAREAASIANTALIDRTARTLPGQDAALDAVTTQGLQSLSVLSVVAFTVATPLGWLAVYLVVSGIVRAISAGVGQPYGDLLWTGIDAVASRRWARARESARRQARERLEGPNVADRLIAGDALGLPSTDVIVLAARQKADWTAGTIVVTPDAWFRLAEPFDVELPQGLRTAYPLTQLETIEVLRRSVTYTLPPLQRAPQGLHRAHED
jgi:hypothetical protein